MSGLAVTMPRLSDSMEAGTVITWLTDDGASVHRGDPIAEIESDKAVSEYAAPAEGVLHHLVAAGTTTQVGTPIATIGEVTDRPSPMAAPTGPAGSEPADVSCTPRETPADPPENRPAPKLAARPKASPVARRLARAEQLDLTTIVGSGPRGRVVRQDVLDAATARDGARDDAAKPELAAPSNGRPSAEGERGQVTEQLLSRSQQVIARRMSESRATVPDFEVRTVVDATSVDDLRRELKAGESDVVPSVNDLVVKAAALALREIPRANATHQGDHWELWSRINIGVAVALPDGLVVPTLFDVDTLSVGAIAARTRELAQLARDGRLDAAQLSGGTFTISNLGMFGVTGFSAVLFAPQSAILSVGAAVRTPVVRGEEIIPGLLMELGLSCDHRILYGADGARLLALIKQRLESPLSLLVS